MTIKLCKNAMFEQRYAILNVCLQKYDRCTVTILLLLLLLMCYDLRPTKRLGYAETGPQFEISPER